MVECEFVSFAYNIGSIAGFNRYMVECEFCKIEDWNINITVLIDTWWNVNLFRMIYKISAF